MFMKSIETKDLSADDLLKADRFFKAGYKAADAETKSYVEKFSKELLGRKAETPRRKEKYLACVADFLVMVQKSGRGLVAWQTGSENYVGCAYSRQVAEETRKALLKSGDLELIQQHGAQLCKIYMVNKKVAPDRLVFKKGNSTNVVRVRAASTLDNGKRKKGRLIPLKRFKTEQTLPIIEEMEALNVMMEAHPLKAPDGTQWDGCYRGFNNGDPSGNRWINAGGRVYGGWQSRSEQERLQFTIDGEEVCEVDIKACYLFLGLQHSPSEADLPADPYQLVRFVNEEKNEARRKELRQLAKVLTSAMLSKDGQVTRFPRGAKRSDGNGNHSIREQYRLGKKVKCQDLVHQIEQAFPFIMNTDQKGLELMFQESEVMIGAMLALDEIDIPTFPVHDCLLCQAIDEDEVVKEIQEQMMKRYESYPSLEVGYNDGTNKVILSSQIIGFPSSVLSSLTTLEYDEDEDTDDYPVIEDF